MTIWFDDARTVLASECRGAHITVLISAVRSRSTRNHSPCRRSRAAQRHPTRSWASPICGSSNRHGRTVTGFQEWNCVEPLVRAAHAVRWWCEAYHRGWIGCEVRTGEFPRPSWRPAPPSFGSRGMPRPKADMPPRDRWPGRPPSPMRRTPSRTRCSSGRRLPSSLMCPQLAS